MLMKYKFLKKNHMVQRIYSNTLLGSDSDIIRPLCVRPPHMAGYARKF